MMQYKTYLDIKSKVNRDLDLEDEIFISDQELLDYCNEAIDEAEAEIHTIYEDYFLTKGNISLVQDQEEYDLPTDIYANKIRGIVYSDGSTIYQIPRLRHSDKFELIELTKNYTTTDFYKYLVLNTTASSNPKLMLIPAARETASNRLVIWYIRNANKMVDDTSICDIPEFAHFIIQYIKVRCLMKEGHPNYSIEAQKLEKDRRLMINTLSNMVPDGDTLMEIDTDIYDGMS